MRQKPHRLSRGWRYAILAILALGALAVPVTAAATAEHIVIPIVNQPTPWDPFEDPCTGITVHGTGIENGFVKITELGDRGHHIQLRVDGRVDLMNDADEFVGTWTYRIRFSDQFPPDAQGAVRFQAVGPIEYADGSSAVITLHEHAVFAKGDIEKRTFEKARCR